MPTERHETGLYLALAVGRLFARGSYSMLANPDLPLDVDRAMVKDMTAAGRLHEGTRGAREPMWVRGAGTPGRELLPHEAFGRDPDGWEPFEQPDRAHEVLNLRSMGDGVAEVLDV